MRPSLSGIGLTWITLSVCFAQGSGAILSKAPPGYELYSWPRTAGGWNFCIRPNTNSEGTVEQVFNKRTVLHGVSQLERRISGLPAGAKIYWVDRIPSGKGPRAKGGESLAYPPAEIREQVRGYAARHHIEVDVLSPLFDP